MSTMIYVRPHTVHRTPHTGVVYIEVLFTGDNLII